MTIAVDLGRKATKQTKQTNKLIDQKDQNMKTYINTIDVGGEGLPTPHGTTSVVVI